MKCEKEVQKKRTKLLRVVHDIDNPTKYGEICGLLIKASPFEIFQTTVLIGIVKTTCHCCGRLTRGYALQKHYWRANVFGREKPSLHGTFGQKNDSVRRLTVGHSPMSAARGVYGDNGQ